MKKHHLIRFWLFIVSIFLCSCASPTPTSEPTAIFIHSTKTATSTPAPTKTNTPTPLPPEITRLLQNGGNYDAANNVYVDKDGVTKFKWESGKWTVALPEVTSAGAIRSENMVGADVTVYYDQDGNIPEVGAGFNTKTGEEIGKAELYRLMLEKAGLNSGNAWPIDHTIDTDYAQRAMTVLVTSNEPITVQLDDYSYPAIRVIVPDLNDSTVVHELLLAHEILKPDGSTWMKPFIFNDDHIVPRDFNLYGHLLITQYVEDALTTHHYPALLPIFDSEKKNGLNVFDAMKEEGKVLDWGSNMLVVAITSTDLGDMLSEESSRINIDVPTPTLVITVTP